MNAKTDSHFPGPGTQEDRDLKARHAAMWASGDYPLLAREVVSGLGGHLVDALAPQSGERVLDIAAGTGNAAIPAAARGAAAALTALAQGNGAGVRPMEWEYLVSRPPHLDSGRAPACQGTRPAPRWLR
jgi:hypothetical protein